MLPKKIYIPAANAIIRVEIFASLSSIHLTAHFAFLPMHSNVSIAVNNLFFSV